MRTVGTGVVECWSNGVLVFIRSRIDGLVDCWIDAVDFVRAGSSLHHSNTPLLRCFAMVPEVGIAPTSPPLQGGANLPQLLGEWSSRQVMLLRLPVINRALCF